MSGSPTHGALTEGRRTTVTWGLTEEVLAEPSFVMRRAGRQMSPTALSTVERLASGVWILSPVAGRSEIHELSAAQASTLRLADVNAASTFTEVPTNRALTELTGIGAAAGVATSGDYFFTKRVAAGASWNATVPGGPSAPTLPSTNYPMDRVLVSKAWHAAQTSYQFTLLAPGTAVASPDWLATFYFGGPLIGDSTAAHTGYGQFALSLAGTGRARLNEWIDGAWALVNEWRFQQIGQGAVSAIALRIIPHFPRFIEFRTITTAFDDGLLNELAAIGKLAIKGARQDPSGVTAFVHETANRGPLAAGASAGGLLPITGIGPVALDVRRDLALRAQIHRIQYPASGTITDGAFTLPVGVAGDRVAKLTLLGYDYYLDDVTAATQFTAVMQTAAGGSLTTASETYTLGGATHTFTGYVPPGGTNACRVQFTLTNLEPSGARWHSPALTAYEVERRPVIQSYAQGAFTGGILREFSISSAGYQPDHETASLTIDDPSNQLAALRTRGKIGCRLEVSYPADAYGPAGSAILFEGYGSRITAKRRGKAGREYPSPNWHEFDAELVGKWDRLQGQFFMTRRYFNDEATSPSGRTSRLGGPPQPWKVTDAIRVVLQDNGVSDSRMSIFDDDIRLWARSNQDAEGTLVVPPGTSVTEYLTRIARDYLNAALIWDPNAGAAGMWRLVQPPDGTEPIRWNFVYQTASGNKLPHLSASYGASTSPIFELEERPVPPEGNVLTFSGGNRPGTATRVQWQLVNPASWNAPAHPASANINDLDHLGFIEPIEYVDVSVTDPAAALFFARRLYNLACRGELWAEWTAELVLIAPSDDPLLTVRKRRMLRTGDAVTIDGARYIIESVNPSVRKSHMMMAHYSARLFRPFLTFS
jgi:hypothetical protein